MTDKHLKELINAYNIKLDKNGYGKSIMQHNTSYCYRCGRSSGKLDRHEIFGGAIYRNRSKALGLWIVLCHDSCHLNGVHTDYTYAEKLRQKAQEAARREYGWTDERFITEFKRRSYL